MGQQGEIMCKCQMDEDFNCPHCGENMTDHLGCYVCGCGFID